MTILSKPLRSQLETTIKQAREIAEEAAKEAIARMGVAEAEVPAHLSDDNRALRRRLRAHARTLGDTRDAAGAMSTARLQDAASYEIWHRMLFGRFLAERGLLIHPELGAAVSVAELRDLAKEEGAADEWALAERYAAPGLPGVFKPDDPVLTLPIAPEFSKRLRAVLSGLPEEVFTADDSLGWTYQFWRAPEKDAVNAAGGKIGAAELPAVTQLFTETYMVKFLLHNTLGAWWAGKVLARDRDLARDAADEDTLRAACALPGIDWEFLRFVRDDEGAGPWRPAAGTFPSWPSRAAEITYCDPCCGSGHFLVEAFAILTALRLREESLSPADVAVAVLRDNLHGLELDGRCVQIASFNVALAAWKLAGVPIPLPSPNIAWVGAPPPMSRAEMAALAAGDMALRRALESLHDKFSQAPILGSLLELSAGDLLDADLRERGDLALASVRGNETERAEGAIAARGLLDATGLLARRYVLVATNVPFLGYRDMERDLLDWIRKEYPNTKGDLGYCIWQKFLSSACGGGTVAVVTLQHWMSAISYTDFRRELLSSKSLHMLAYLGAGGFETISGEKVNVTLSITSSTPPESWLVVEQIDAGSGRGSYEKSRLIAESRPTQIYQAAHLKRKQHVVSFVETNLSNVLGDYSRCFTGMMNGDTPKFVRNFCEIPNLSENWTYLQTTTKGKPFSGGFANVIYFDAAKGHLREDEYIRREKLHNSDERGNLAWEKCAVAINQMAGLGANYYYGNKYDANVAVILPRMDIDLLPIFSFAASSEFVESVRSIDKKMNVMGGTINRVPFDIERWRLVAAAEYPNGLPEPQSDDPTQWHFHGHPAYADEGTELHVALARLAGYRWPAETDATMRLSDLAKERLALVALPGIDPDGLLPLRASGDDVSLADRLRSLLGATYGAPLPPSREQALVRAADARLDKKEARDATLEVWLADRAFRQHSILFDQRPFIWQVWDGMNGGFSAFINYHRLDRAVLDKLTYTLLGDWIRTAKAEGNIARLERAQQLQQKLAKIIEGESPYDIFVRWKPLARQPLGWNPDLDDGVRLNIRPFMTAGILRERPKGISWNKDRGTDVTSAPWYDLGPRYAGKQGDRINDHHTTLAEKRAARGTS
jgi:hypothetical protein